MAEIVFVLGDKLPYAYEVVTSILSFAPGGSAYENKETRKRKDAINAYVQSLICLWSKAFGANHITARKVVTAKIRKLIVNYHLKVTNIRKKEGASSSVRTRRLQWRNENNFLVDILRKDSNPEAFEEKERLFYFAQKKVSREGYISDQIDEEHTANVEAELAQRQAEQQRIDEEIAFINDEETTSDSILPLSTVQLNQYLNRSGVVCATTSKTNFGTQTDNCNPLRRPIRAIRNCSQESKDTCAQLSVQCGLSVEMSRLAFVIVSHYYFGVEYYLTVDDARAGRSSLAPSTTQITTDEEPPAKKRLLSTKSDYIDYQYVVPSSKTISVMKQYQSLEQERKAVVSLQNKPSDVKTTLHFDTTTRSTIDGDWPAIILIFSNNQRYNLRPILFSYEDRENIARIIVETYERLAIAASVSTSTNVTAAQLWEKTTSFMTDSPTKNLHVGELVSEKLNTTHVPLSLLCKSHCVEALDRSNIAVLAQIEKQLGMREKLERINPALRSFFRGEKAIVVAGIKCLLNLVTHEKSASATNIADEFDHIVERENKVKHLTLYHERRFCKLGYVCAAINDAFPLLQMLLFETAQANLHIESSKLYLECEFFLTELSVLAYFTHKVSLPLLNCVEVCGQEELLTILPQLYLDLSEGNMNTLDKYTVTYKHVPVSTDLSNLELRILLFMCQHAAESLKLQCGREYGFADPGEEGRATDLTKLTPEELFGLPTNNLVCERWLSIFGKRAVVGKFRNKNFQAKGIRADLVLHKANYSKAEKVTKQISKLLKVRELSWTNSQKELQKKRIEEKHRKGRQHDIYVDKLLSDCKGWKGPCVTLEELVAIIESQPKLAEKIVRTELAYYRHTHRSDVIARPELFKLNKITHAERLENLCILLRDETLSATSDCATGLPSNNEAITVLENHPGMFDEEPNRVFRLNQLCLTTWVNEEGEPSWSIGYFIHENTDGTFEVEQLYREKPGKDLYWHHPSEEIRTVTLQLCDIYPVTPTGDWEASKTGEIIFKLRNGTKIGRSLPQKLGAMII